MFGPSLLLTLLLFFPALPAGEPNGSFAISIFQGSPRSTAGVIAASPLSARPVDVTGLYVANKLNYHSLPRIERVPSTDGWEHWFKLEEGLITLRPDNRFIASFRYYRQHVRPGTPVRPGSLLNESYKGKYSLKGTTITFTPDKTKQTRGVKPIVGTLSAAQLTIPYIVAQGQSAHPLRLDLKREGSW